MKKLFILTITLFVFVCANAQLKFGPKVGFNFANMSEKYKIASGSMEKADTKITLGLQFGGVVDYELMEGLSIQPGLLLSGKGASSKHTYQDVDDNGNPITVTETYKITPLYVEIPINAIYKKELKSIKIFANAGPYLALGIGGKSKNDDNGTKTSHNIKWGSGKDDTFKGTDFGFNIGGGVEIGKIMAGINYGLGLSNIDSDGSSDFIVKNRVFSISCAYLFGGK